MRDLIKFHLSLLCFWPLFSLKIFVLYLVFFYPIVRIFYEWISALQTFSHSVDGKEKCVFGFFLCLFIFIPSFVLSFAMAKQKLLTNFQFHPMNETFVFYFHQEFCCHTALAHYFVHSFKVAKDLGVCVCVCEFLEWKCIGISSQKLDSKLNLCKTHAEMNGNAIRWRQHE